MDSNFQPAKDQIAQKVRQFAANRAAYLAPAYKEAHARQELIDPFFEALGWDVRNTERAAPDYRQVVVEDALDVEGQRKAPDYAFRVGCGAGRGRTGATGTADRLDRPAD